MNMTRWSEVSKDRLDQNIDHLKEIRDVKLSNQLSAQLKKRGENPKFPRKRYPTMEYSSSEYESKSPDNDRSDLDAPTLSSTSRYSRTSTEDEAVIPPSQNCSITLVDTDVPSGTAPPSLLDSPTFSSNESTNNSDYSARVNPLFQGAGVPWIFVNSDSSSNHDSACKRCRLESPPAPVEYPQPRVEYTRATASEPTDEAPAIPHGDSPDDESTKMSIESESTNQMKK